MISSSRSPLSVFFFSLSDSLPEVEEGTGELRLFRRGKQRLFRRDQKEEEGEESKEGKCCFRGEDTALFQSRGRSR